MKKVLILAGIYWDDTFQRHQQFATYFTQMGYEVYFVEHIISTKFSFSKVWQVIKGKVGKKRDKVKKEQIKPDNVTVINLKLLNPMKGLFDIYNRNKINSFLKIYGKEFDIVVNYLPIQTTLYFQNQVNTKIKIYDCVRNFSAWQGYSKNVGQYEKKIVKASDLILTDSYYLTNKMREFSTDKVRQFLPVVTKDWMRGVENASRRSISEIKRIGYFGTVDEHVDVEVFAFLNSIGVQVHIWGIVKTEIPCDYVYYGYEVNMEVLSRQIVEKVDSLIIPYKDNMDGVIPAKMMQCIYTGLPIFISEFYDSKVLEEYLYVYSTREQLMSLLQGFDGDNHKHKQIKIKEFIETKNDVQQYEQFRKLFDS